MTPSIARSNNLKSQQLVSVEFASNNGQRVTVCVRASDHDEDDTLDRARELMLRLAEGDDQPATRAARAAMWKAYPQQFLSYDAKLKGLLFPEERPALSIIRSTRGAGR